MNDQPAPPDRPADDSPTGGSAGAGSAKRGRPLWQPALVLAAALLAVVGIVAAVAAVAGTGNDDRDGDDGVADEGRTTPPAAVATVAVTYTEPSMGATTPVDLTLRFVRQDGGVIARRTWSEVEEQAANAGDGTPPGGLVQDVPAGELELDATLQGSGGPASCTQSFRTTQGDRLILRLDQGQLGGMSSSGEAPCAPVQPVAEWVEGRTSATGEPYIGLSQAEAESRARSEGLTTRVVGIDGADLMTTLDLRPDRLDLMVFDGTVVAAQLGAEPPVAGPP